MFTSDRITLLSLTRRVGNFQPFLRSNSREDNRYQGLQAGFVTYEQASSGDDDAYQISYLELGGRSDHLHDAFTVDIEADNSPCILSKSPITRTGLLSLIPSLP